MMKNILITGYPGVGKTTLIKKLIKELKDLPSIGFYTQEIREKGTRVGFELISLKDKKRLLSHTQIKSHYRVGKYGVDIKGFEEFIETILLEEINPDLYIIDEIGRMECFSVKFRMFLKGILDSNKVVLATIALKGNGLIGEIKERADVKLFEITQENRDTLFLEVLKQVKGLLLEKRSLKEL